MSLKVKRCKPLVVLVMALGLCACEIAGIKEGRAKQEVRWYNSQSFDSVESMGTSLYDLEFDIAFSAADGGAVEVQDCLEVFSTSDGEIAEKEFARWEFLKANCEAANRFYRAPEAAASYWSSSFDFSLLKTLPSTVIPYLGGQGLEGRRGSLSELETTLSLLESNEHSVKVSFDNMIVDYVLVSRADFNRDGFQDLFIRMDWYIEEALGGGHDWVVVTQTSPNAGPMVLWRK